MPERTCILTRQVRQPQDLIRFVQGPDQTIFPDLKCKLPGRGVWVTANRRSVEEAVRKKAFARAFKAEVKASPVLAEEVEALMRRDVLQAFSLANKAGGAVCGAAKIEAAILEGEIVALIHAKEAASDSRRKLQAALKRHFGDGVETIAIIGAFAEDELDLAFGRAHVIHAALKPKAGTLCLARWRRFQRFQGEPGPPEAPGSSESA